MSKSGDGWISDDVITDSWKTLSRGLWKRFSSRLCYIRGPRFDFHKQGNTIRKRLRMIDNSVFFAFLNQVCVVIPSYLEYSANWFPFFWKNRPYQAIQLTNDFLFWNLNPDPDSMNSGLFVVNVVCILITKLVRN